MFVIGLAKFVLLKDEHYLTLMGFGFRMMPALGLMFNKSQYNLLVYYPIILAIIGIAFAGGVIINLFTFLFILAFAAFQWIANIIRMHKY